MKSRSGRRPRHGRKRLKAGGWGEERRAKRASRSRGPAKATNAAAFERSEGARPESWCNVLWPRMPPPWWAEKLPTNRWIGELSAVHCSESHVQNSFNTDQKMKAVALPKLPPIPQAWNDESVTPRTLPPNPDLGAEAIGIFNGWKPPGWSLARSGLNTLLAPQTVAQIDFGDGHEGLVQNLAAGQADHNSAVFMDPPKEPITSATLVGSTPEGISKRAADWAKAQVNGTDYQMRDRSDEIGGRRSRLPFGLGGIGAPKCNIFVGDAFGAAGIHVDNPVNNGAPYPGAKEWGAAHVQIPGFRVLGQHEKPQAGDVMTDGHHVGIYVPGPKGEDMTVSAAAMGYGDQVVHNAWGFRGDEGPIVTRRFVGTP